MTPRRRISRRSFLSLVAGSAAAGSLATVSGSSHAETAQGCTDRDPSPPRGDPAGRGRNCRGTTSPTDTGRPSGCSDSDTGANADPGGRGRRCSPASTGCSDSDSGANADPGGRGRRCSQVTTGCSDSDSGANADPGGRGRRCGGNDGRNGATPTGRRERTYEICWVDPGSRSGGCNWQTYTDWRTTYSDGSVVDDTAASDARKAEMRRRGYTAGNTRTIVNDW